MKIFIYLETLIMLGQYPNNLQSSPNNIPNIFDKPTSPLARDTSEAYNSLHNNSNFEIQIICEGKLAFESYAILNFKM